ATLKEEPEEVTELNSKVSPQLGRIVQRCLEKKTERRFQSTSDLCFALETLTTASGAQAAAAIVVRGRNRERYWIAATAILLLALIAALPFVIAYFRRSPAHVYATRFVIPASEKQAFLSSSISPDGRRLVYGTSTEGKQQLWIRQLDSLTAQPLPGTDKAFGRVVWSPDSRYICFFADGKLKQMDLSGGPAQPLADAPDPAGGSWNQDGLIVFSP